VNAQLTPALLVLQDGTVFQGTAIGKIGTTTGEICFNTGMTGYQEVFTDPSYFGQILVMTSDHIGNYGVHDEEIESDGIKIAGLVCKKFSHNYSRKNGSDSLDSYFMSNGLVGISEIDTRELVRHLRDTGAKNAIISSENFDVSSLLEQLNAVPSMDGLELASKVSTGAFHTMGNQDAPLRVALLDYGNKLNISRCLVDRGCYLGIFPWNATAEEVMAWNPDGLMISNGPGDPAAMTDIVELVRNVLLEEIPFFGICFGHQILGRALGFETYKLPFGHRGINQFPKMLTFIMKISYFSLQTLQGRWHLEPQLVFLSCARRGP